MIHISNFGDKVKLMNQTYKQNLMLSADEARNLESEIYELLAKIVNLTSNKPEKSPDDNSAALDGGKY